MTSVDYIKCEKVTVKLADIDLPCWVSVDNPEQRFLSGRNITDAVGAAANSLLRSMGVRSLKALSERTFERSIKVRPISKGGSPFDPISLDIATEYWGKESQNQNNLATALLVACAQETLDRRIDTALGLRRSEEEYEARTALRRKTLIARRTWTDQIKLRQEALGYYRGPDGKITQRATDEYRTLTVRVNEVLFNQPHFNCNRDNMTLEQQVIIESFEGLLTRWAVKYPQKSAKELVEDCLDIFSVQAA